MITNKGHALGVLFDRLHLAADPEQDGWKEDEGLKSVQWPLATAVQIAILTGGFVDNSFPEHDRRFKGFKLLDPRHNHSSHSRNMVCGLSSTVDCKVLSLNDASVTEIWIEPSLRVPRTLCSPRIHRDDTRRNPRSSDLRSWKHQQLADPGQFYQRVCQNQCFGQKWVIFAWTRFCL